MESKREHYLKVAILLVYAIIVLSLYLFMSAYDLSFRDMGRMAKALIVASGHWGPLMMLIVYAVSTIIPFPTTGLAVVSGALFGPVFGIMIAMLGVNLTSWISFFLARYFGRHVVQEREKGWVKDLDDLLSEKGFYPIMIMRLLFVPSDFVSLGSGLTRMPFKTFAFATFFGTLPATVLFALFGESLFDPKGRIVLGVAIVCVITLVLILRKVPFMKKFLPK
jgi:uncharacterized membrane protein YdjX (TVP38/TMEM64 family)